MTHYCYSFMMEWGDWICGIGMAMFWIFSLVVTFIFLKKLCPHFSKESNQENNGDKTIEILKNRYVNGEIDRVEFAEKKKDLEE